MDPVTIISVVIGLAGMLFHFWKRKLKKQSFVNLRNYIVGHPVYSIAATVATVVACVAAAPAEMAMLSNPVTISMLFAFGFSCDSLLNKDITEA